MSRSKKIRHYVELAGVKLVLSLVRLLPLRAATAFGALLGWKAYRVFRIRRGVSIDNIQRSLPYATRKRIADRIACASYMNFGRTMVEFALFDRLDNETVRRLVDLDGREHFDRALKAGKGAILFSGHIGNFELLGAAIAAYGYPLDLLVGRQTNPLVDDMIVNLRRGHVGGIIRKEQAPKQVFRSMGDNRFVAMVADQDARDDGVFVDFLGRPASTVRGPALFAVRRNAPLVAGFIHRIGGGRHRAEILPPMWPDPNLKGNDAVVDLVQRYTDALSDAVRRYPAEYFWAHRRWKTVPPQPAGN